jgi:hypothetical protein
MTAVPLYVFHIWASGESCRFCPCYLLPVEQVLS